MNRLPHGGRSVLGDALLHPVALGALGLLVLNDHALKAAYPGFLTGKLSDAAGLVVFPLFLHALLEMGFRAAGASFERCSRVAAFSCAAFTAAAFAAVKSIPPATELYRVGLGALQCVMSGMPAAQASSCRALVAEDVTDLWTLPFVLVSVWLMAQRSIERESELQPE